MADPHMIFRLRTWIALKLIALGSYLLQDARDPSDPPTLHD